MTNLSGVALATCLAKALTSSSQQILLSILVYSRDYRIHRLAEPQRATTAPDQARFGLGVYWRSREFLVQEEPHGIAEIDRAVVHVLQHSGQGYTVRDFSPNGYDERQYCSPGINLPVGCFSRTPHGQFPEYHTSADDLNFVDPSRLLTHSVSVWPFLTSWKQTKFLLAKT